MAAVVNLNNEVVKMRKDVKKVKVLTIRRLTRQMSKLKSKKGTDELIQKNQRRAQRLLEELYAIKKLKPDDVTKTALRKDLNFENVCKKQGSDLEARAIARLAMHPLLKHKISTLKDAVKAFKETRKATAELESKSEESCEQPKTVQTPRTKTECKQGKTKQKPKDSKAKHMSVDMPASKTLPEDIDLSASKQEHEGDTPDLQKSSQAPPLLEIPVVSDKMKTDDCIPEIGAVNNGPEGQESLLERKSVFVHKSDSEIEDSDIEDSDKEEKEYFDDSTEERFFKKGSDFDESDSESDGDFFIGKVRRAKKRGSKNSFEDQVKTGRPTKLSDGHSEMQKKITAPKTTKLQSVFCTSLSNTKQKSSLMKRENKPLPVCNKKAVPQVNKFPKKPQPARSTTVLSQSKPEAALHPSWEASRKRKEQSQIAAFQGKKIVFDD
ncbi:serum response factor-binding protein 1 [Gastrophryne carolinensis]